MRNNPLFKIPTEESDTVGFFDSMNEVDLAVKSMTAMLNRHNVADVFIGIDKDGNLVDPSLSEEDVRTVQSIISKDVHNHPDVQITLEENENGRCIRIHAVGYEIPYSYRGWFYCRRCVRSKENGTIDGKWITTVTCGMKRHRIIHLF